MSYASEILADTPIVWSRTSDLTGSTMSDASGNNRDGVYDRGFLLGRPSAIETEPSDRAIQILTAAGDSADPQGVYFPHLSAYDLTDAVTIEAWVEVNALPGSSQTIFGKRSGTINAPYILYYRSNIGWAFSVQIGGTDYYITATSEPQLDAWYHVVGVRTGSILRIYINGSIANERTDIPTGSLNTNSYELTIGGHPVYNTRFIGGDIDEPALYASALSSTRILAHYEAAKTTLNMAARISGRSTVMLNSAEIPDPSPFAWRHNWSASVVERLTWKTHLRRSSDGYEQRDKGRARPRRDLEYKVTTQTVAMRRRLENFIWSHQNSTVALPIWTDRTSLAAAATSGETVIAVNTQYLDYDVGGRVMLLNPDTNASEVGVIDSLTSSQITLTAPLDSTWAAGTAIAPCKRAILEPVSSLKSISPKILEIPVEARVLVEDVPAAPNRVTAFTPATTYRGVEVFNPFTWRDDTGMPADIDYQVDRSMHDEEIGVFSVSSAWDAPQPARGYKVFLTNRAAISTFLGWLEARAGRLNPFWLPTLEEDFDVVSRSGSTVTTRNGEYIATYNVAASRRDVAFVYTDHTMAFRRINSAAYSGSDEVLTLDSSAPVITNLRCLSFLTLCRLDADAVELAWLTHSKARVNLRFRELLTTP